MKFDNKYFVIDNKDAKNSSCVTVFYDNNIYIKRYINNDTGKYKAIVREASYGIYVLGTYYISPALGKIFSGANYNKFMFFIRILSLSLFLICFILSRINKNTKKFKNNYPIENEKVEETSLNYIRVKDTFKNNIFVYSMLFILVIIELFVLFSWFKKDCFIQLLMVMLSSILGICFGAENFIAAFVWKFKYLKRHKNDEK